ncbi:glycosyltransferase family 4 protein [candidate division KSB1 bacterium]|nr:glycosyltransferase family 4 protein [candidate division KSB1 bacterium]RQW10691.1 MAG: glycosyltransferase family 4 protein [candidate division KSB1 bacterium]
MKILVFTSLFPNNVSPNHGVFIRERVARVARHGTCEVKVVAPAPYYPPIQWGARHQFARIAHHEFQDDLEVFHPRFFMIPKVGMATYGWTMYRSLLPAMKKIAAQFDFDLIDAHYMYPDCAAAVMLGRYFGKPVVVSARGSDINLFSHFPFIRRLMCRAMQGADRIIAVSRALQEAMIDMGIDSWKIAVIPNGVDASMFHPIDRRAARAQLQLPDGKIVLSVGALRPLKGFDIMIRAWRRLLDRRKGDSLHLLIAGEGESREELRALIRELSLEKHVRLIGAIPHNELNLYFNAADLFCLASSREGWPNVLMEALACGTPVVATKVGGIPEIITSPELGLFAPRTPRDFSDVLENALQKEWHRNVLVEYTQRMTWERTAAQVVGLFESVLKPQSQ